MRILIVDDEQFSRVMLSDLLGEYGQCDMAANGYEAIDAFMRARAEGAPYDLICLDIIMPEMDGQQVLKQIRSIEARDSVHGIDAVRVLVVSAMSDLEHIMMSFDSRYEAYMMKPVDRQQLVEHLALLGFNA
ncbi:MAG: response regulator [Desulfuromonadales bacterium]